jgi:HK97 family phage prohead protease
MPWHIEQGGGSCGSSEWAVIKDSDGSTEGCHPTKAEAEDHMAALYANEEQAKAAGRARSESLREQFGAKQASRGPSNGPARLQPFAAQELRAKLIEHEGQERYQLDGYATVFERGYEMWDFFGPYTEIVSAGAADATLAADPDVAFLVNHRGVTMARTTSKTLLLEADALGLRPRAYVNPKRQDVRDLVVAIDDKDITEMSFAFLIDDGEWSEDFTTYRINAFNLDRGDVSAVNYGANPYTSIAARSREVLADLDHLPAGAQRAAYERLARRLDPPDPHPPAAAPQNGSRELAKVGRSVSLVLAQLALDDDQ